jgi:hypothetical protein
MDRPRKPELTGVRISNAPLYQIEGESGDAELTMEIPEDLFTEYEEVWSGQVEGERYREARMAAFFKCRARIRTTTRDRVYTDAEPHPGAKTDP